MDDAENFLLADRLQIDQKIAAAHQVDARKGRILENILSGEHHRIPDSSRNQILAVPPGKESIEPLRGNVERNVLRVDAPASDLDGVLVDVGTEDLDVSARRLVLQELK